MAEYVCIPNCIFTFVLCLRVTISVFAASAPTTIPFANNCSAVAQILQTQDVNFPDISIPVTNDKVLRFCENTPGSCCTSNIEAKLFFSSRLELERNIKEYIGKLATVLGTRAQKFNDFFGQLLSESKKKFHQMFTITYGIMYEQNAYVFSDLFSELEKYYLRGKVDLSEAMDSFFNTLYQKMFTVINAQYSFNDKYLGCVSEHMKELKPFGDVPDKLSVQIKRSFIATRTYAQALITASDVAKKVMHIRPGENCTVALMKMQNCNACKGYTEKPCASYCVNVIKGCLQHYNELDLEWDNFVSSMEKISERLLGPFNIVVVVDPINIKISEAIMNFQETASSISSQVFQGCGRPTLGRQKRMSNRKYTKQRYVNLTENLDADILDRQQISKREIFIDERVKRSTNGGADISYDSLRHLEKHSDERSNKKNKKKQKGRKGPTEDENNKEPVLDKLIKDIRQKVKDSKKFWSNLPYQICSNEEMSAAPDSNKCWNGNNIDGFPHSVSGDQMTNPDSSNIPVTSRQNTLVGHQLYYLKTAINHLQNAYNGRDVEWSDQDDPYYGSGSGSGGGIDEEEESGSGSQAFDEVHSQLPDNDDESSVRLSVGKTSGHLNNTVVKHIPSIEKENEVKASDTAAINTISIQKVLLFCLFPIYVVRFGEIIFHLL